MKYMRLIALVLALLICLPACSRESEAPPAPVTRLPILMYHHLAEEGPYNTMTVSPDSFRKDMEWLRDNGFTALLPSDLVRIAEGTLQMPERPVMISFDDGYNSNYDLAFPILQETGMRATIALITCVNTNDDYVSWGMSWRMIREMQDSGIIEFGCHTDFLHDDQNPTGLTRLEGETQEAYIARISKDLLYSKGKIEEHTGVPCIYLAYPFGKSDPWLVEWLQQTGTFAVTTTTTTDMADLAEGLIGLKRIRMSMEEHPYDREPIQAMLKTEVKLKQADITLTVRDQETTGDGLTANGRGVVSVRALAQALSGSDWQFDIGWDSSRECMTLTRGVPYSGGANSLPVPKVIPKKAAPQNVPVLVDGQLRTLTGYKIDGSWYFRPDALATLLGYTVTGTGTVLQIG